MNLIFLSKDKLFEVVNVILITATFILACLSFFHFQFCAKATVRSRTMYCQHTLSILLVFKVYMSIKLLLVSLSRQFCIFLLSVPFTCAVFKANVDLFRLAFVFHQKILLNYSWFLTEKVFLVATCITEYLCWFYFRCQRWC